MNDADAERIRERRNPGWNNGVRCACCGKPPTCPQIHDELWDPVWDHYQRRVAEGYAYQRQLECTCRIGLKSERDDGTHSQACEKTHERVRELLCLECFERELGRQLTLEDLTPCMGNYAHYVMQKRGE